MSLSKISLKIITLSLKLNFIESPILLYSSKYHPPTKIKDVARNTFKNWLLSIIMTIIRPVNASLSSFLHIIMSLSPQQLDEYPIEEAESSQPTLVLHHFAAKWQKLFRPRGSLIYHRTSWYSMAFGQAHCPAIWLLNQHTFPDIVSTTDRTIDEPTRSKSVPDSETRN